MKSPGQCSRSSDSGRKLSSIGSESALESRSGEEIFSTEEGATSNFDSVKEPSQPNSLSC